MPNVCFFPGCPKKTGDFGRGRRKVSFFRFYCHVLQLRKRASDN